MWSKVWRDGILGPLVLAVCFAVGLYGQFWFLSPWDGFNNARYLAYGVLDGWGILRWITARKELLGIREYILCGLFFALSGIWVDVLLTIVLYGGRL